MCGYNHALSTHVRKQAVMDEIELLVKMASENNLLDQMLMHIQVSK